jgi:prepilin-type N-terminal cleavage/methylation domain-containing protein
MKKNLGFTLIEIVIVLAIIGVLGAVIISAINPFEIQASGRDNIRLTELNNIVQALELYFAENKSYPQPLNAGGNPFRIPVSVLTKYNPSVRTADSLGCNYLYRLTANPKKYELFAIRESKGFNVPSNSLFDIPLRSSIIPALNFGSAAPCSNSTNLLRYTRNF